MNQISNVYSPSLEKKKKENSSIFRQSNLKEKLESLFINPNFLPNNPVKYKTPSNKTVKFISFDSPVKDSDVNILDNQNKNLNKYSSHENIRSFNNQNANITSPSLFSEQNAFKKKKSSMDNKDNYNFEGNQNYFGSIGKNVMDKGNSKNINKVKFNIAYDKNNEKEDNNDIEIVDFDRNVYQKGKKKKNNLYLKTEEFEKAISNINNLNDNQIYSLNSDRQNYNKSLFQNNNNTHHKNEHSFNLHRNDSEIKKSNNILNSFEEINNLKKVSQKSMNKMKSEKTMPRIILSDMSNFNKNLDNENNNNNNEKNHSHHRSHHHHHSRSKSKNKNNDSKEIENYEKHHKRNNENKIREFSTPEIQHKHKSKAKIENNQNEKLMKMKHKILSNPEIKIKIDKEENKVKHSYIFSRAGKIEDQKEKTNQDSYLKIEHINGFEDFNIYGIFDGHGSSGHLVSKFIVNYLTEYYKYNEEILKRKTIENIYSLIKKKNYLFIKESIKKSEEALFDSEEIDSTFSGTTCILIFIIGTKIISVNIGDSRAIMLNEKKKIIELSIDQKPENLEEKERIEKNGGEIRKIIENNEEIGPMRVWAKGKKYPGIAMSRSIGDSVANEIGVWSLPDIKEYNIQYNSQFIVIGSDGLWEFMSNDKVCKFVYKCKNKSHIQDYLEKLVEKSRKYWEKYDCNIDDITVILITFNYFYKEDNDNENDD